MHGCFEIHPMVRTSVNNSATQAYNFFSDLSRAWNMVRVNEGKFI